MDIGLRARVLPEQQRRTLEELTSDLDLNEGDIRSKRSAYWTMLVLSACIACAGVITDSTATVIGAMIIAPLSTPIMGTALGLVKRERLGGLKFVVLGALLVVAIGVCFALLVPASYDLTGNSQITGRTSPGILDLVSALATGLAGAIALARRDVAAILPGVAISISLVPPLGVAGICLGQGSPGLALGALVLFLSNVLALVFAGSIVFTALGYTSEAQVKAGRPRRGIYATLSVVMVLVLAPLAINTLVSIAFGQLVLEGNRATTQWLAKTPGSEILDVTHDGITLVIRVSAPADLPPTSDLLKALGDGLPDGIPVVLERSVGERVEIGTIGG
jgi:uncharacterized hydrophobic protein (TIGR00271 family)